MTDILIWGVGECSTKIEKIINHKNINITAYIDNNEDKQGKLINNRLVINPNKIKEVKYDYIFIASQYYKEIYTQLINLGIQERKIVNSFKFIKNIVDLELIKIDKKYLYNKFIENYNKALQSADINSVITGISYTECGIDLNVFKNIAVNLALSGQDLYYDYNIAKNIIENTKSKIKNVVIGLGYFSFQYDLSLSKSKSRCIYVYKDILKIHNYKKNRDPKAELLKYINDPMKIDENLFLSDLDLILDKLNVKSEIDFYKNWKRNFNNICLEDKMKEGKQLAELDSNKNYPNTVNENKNILSEYLRFLNDRNIKALVVIFPVTQYYSRYFDVRLKEEFYNIIEELKKKYEFAFIDYFDSNEFSDEDFSDCAHLNIYGARKFTKILNKKI